MSGISASTEAVYMPCYHIDLSARKATLGKYNYTEMMKKAAQQTDDNLTYYEPDEYGRVFVDPAHLSKAAFEPEDASDISLPAPNSACMPAVDAKAEEKAQKKKERKDQDEQAQLLREERLQMDQLEAGLRKFGMPGYRMDFQSWTLTPDLNYFSDLLARQSELAQRGESQLTQQEIEELSGKCDMSRMSSQEYRDLISYLADRGVIDRPEPLGFDPGEPVYIKKGQAWLEPAGTMRNTGTPGVAQFLHTHLTNRSLSGKYSQVSGDCPARGAAVNKGKSSFTYQLSADHSVIVGPGASIPMWTEDTVYYSMDGNGQDVHVTLAEDSTEDDPIVRIKGHSASGEFDFTRHIKDIDPSSASYAEMCALIGWEERINPSGKKGLLQPTPLGMNVGNVTQKQDFVSLSSRYLASGKFGQSIADQTKELLELYQRLIEANHPASDDFQMYTSYRRINDLALAGLIKTTPC